MGKLYKENKVFKKYNHKCELAERLDYVLQLVPGDNLGAKFTRFFYRNITINPLHPQTRKLLRSQMSVTENMKVHLMTPTLIHPFSNFRFWWDVFMILGTLLVAIVLPLQAGAFMFENIKLAERIDVIIAAVIGAIYGLNMIIEFRTGYWDKKNKTIVLKGSKAATHYLITYFLVDLFIIIPITYMPSQYTTNFSITMGLLVAKFSCVARVFHMMSTLVMFLETIHTSYALRRIIEMLLYCMLYLHWHACYNILIINLQEFDAAKEIKIQDWSYNKKEISHFMTLWANVLFACSLVLVQAGVSFYNQTRRQYFIEIMFWISARVVLIFLITNMMLAFKSKRISLSKNTEMFWHLEVYMRSKGMPDYLRNRLLIYYEFRYQKSFFRESEIMSKVSGQLKQDMIMHNCRKLVENVSFFKRMPINFLARIITCMTEEVYLTNDVILKANTTARCMYFIAIGTVAVYTASGEEICHLTEGDHFGEVGLVIQGLKRTASVIAIEICELFRLDSQDFLKAVSPFPDLLAQVEAIAHSRMESTRILVERELTVEHHSADQF